MLPYKFVIFDFDGTLADTLGWLEKVMPETAIKFRFRTINPENYPLLRTLNARELISFLDIPLWKLPLVTRYLRHRMIRDSERISLFPDVDAMLQILTASPLKLGLLTSNSWKNVRQILGKDTVTCFDYYRYGVSILGKASRLHKLMKESGFQQKEALFIGDEIRDLEAAKEAGIRFGAVSWGFNTIETLLKYEPDECFYDVGEINSRLVPGFSVNDESKCTL